MLEWWVDPGSLSALYTDYQIFCFSLSLISLNHAHIQTSELPRDYTFWPLPGSENKCTCFIALSLSHSFTPLRDLAFSFLTSIVSVTTPQGYLHFSSIVVLPFSPFSIMRFLFNFHYFQTYNQPWLTTCHHLYSPLLYSKYSVTQFVFLKNKCKS